MVFAVTVKLVYSTTIITIQWQIQNMQVCPSSGPFLSGKGHGDAIKKHSSIFGIIL